MNFWQIFPSIHYTNETNEKRTWVYLFPSEKHLDEVSLFLAVKSSRVSLCEKKMLDLFLK